MYFERISIISISERINPFLNFLLEVQHLDSLANASMRETHTLLIQATQQNPPGPTIYVSIHKMMTCVVLRAATLCLCFSKEKHETGYIPVNHYLSPVVVLAYPTLCSSTGSQRVSSVSLPWRTQPWAGHLAILTTDSRLEPPLAELHFGYLRHIFHISVTSDLETQVVLK